MVSKRRNMFEEGSKLETTEIGMYDLSHICDYIDVVQPLPSTTTEMGDMLVEEGQFDDCGIDTKSALQPLPSTTTEMGDMVVEEGRFDDYGIDTKSALQVEQPEGTQEQLAGRQEGIAHRQELAGGLQERPESHQEMSRDLNKRPIGNHIASKHLCFAHRKEDKTYKLPVGHPSTKKEKGARGSWQKVFRGQPSQSGHRELAQERLKKFTANLKLLGSKSETLSPHARGMATSPRGRGWLRSQACEERMDLDRPLERSPQPTSPTHQPPPR
ncbi:hypothetical protein AAG570_008060 [Ranatra chinensis]|uniref:Uncharacterized protein n=1 Tax=Ranatra chinensis TaxID=642074 RepID=A0ABD0XUZ6_9HEMI